MDDIVKKLQSRYNEKKRQLYLISLQNNQLKEDLKKGCNLSKIIKRCNKLQQELVELIENIADLELEANSLRGTFRNRPNCQAARSRLESTFSKKNKRKLKEVLDALYKELHRDFKNGIKSIHEADKSVKLKPGESLPDSPFDPRDITEIPSYDAWLGILLLSMKWVKLKFPKVQNLLNELRRLK